MAVEKPSIFVSAASRDLRSCRALILPELLKIGCEPVFQEAFDAHGRTVRELIESKLQPCAAVIHLAGVCYGFEPVQPPPGEPRRSYTQLEYHVARELGKDVYVIICAEDFPYETHEPEDPELRTLQQAHRAALQAGDHLYYTVRTVGELREIVLAIPKGREAVLRAMEEQQRAHAAEIEDKNEEIEEKNEENRLLRAELQKLTQLTVQMMEKMGSPAEAASPAALEERTAVAQAEVAAERGITLEELRRGLAEERHDLRELLARIAPAREAAAAQARQWTELHRDALTKLGDAELAAGRYRESIDPYRQALGLFDCKAEPLAWAVAAADLSGSFRYQGHYAESEALARQVLEIRERTLGEEHPETLIGVHNLAALLYCKGDYAAAEPLLRCAVQGRERTLGPGHPDTLASLNNLAALLYSKGDYLAAEMLYRRALEGKRRALGAEHPSTADSAFNLSVLRARQGDLQEALVLGRDAVAVVAKSLPEGHPMRVKYEEYLAGLSQLATE